MVIVIMFWKISNENTQFSLSQTDLYFKKLKTPSQFNFICRCVDIKETLLCCKNKSMISSSSAISCFRCRRSPLVYSEYNSIGFTLLGYYKCACRFYCPKTDFKRKILHNWDLNLSIVYHIRCG